MPKNVMKLLKPSPHRARNAFDLSHRHVFTANFGELLPISCIETVPGDHIRMNVSDLLRAIPFVTSPFLRAKQHIDVYYVPYTALWSNFNSFMTKRDEPTSAAQNAFNFCPSANLYSLLSAVNTTSETDVMGRSIPSGSVRLLQLLGYGSGTLVGSVDDSPRVNLWRLAAYQKIWYENYRNPYYDSGTRLLKADGSMMRTAQLFNFDDLLCTTESTSNIPVARYLPMAQMRYRAWKKDLYTGLLPSTQFGDVSVVSNDISRISFVNASGGTLGQRVLSTDTTSSLSVSSNVNQGSIPSSWVSDSAYLASNSVQFDVLALRKSEALQIWRENTLRSGNRVADNLNAHYGEYPNFDRGLHSTLIGSVSAPLNIGDINASASTDSEVNGQLGDVAGKGLSSLDEKVFTFDAKDFGVIMVIFSMLPEAEYQAVGIDRMNQLLEMEDYFVPEFENLGFEPVSSQDFRHTPVSQTKIFGYAPRYIGYKQKLDKVFHGFMDNEGFRAWSSPKTDIYSQFSGSSLPIKSLYVDPSLFDPNFGVSLANSDQFLCDVYFNVDAVRPMSVLGLPFS